MKLIGFDFTIEHRSKKSNFVDELSRRFDYFDDVNQYIQQLFSVLQNKLQMINILQISAMSELRTIIVNAIKFCSFRSIESDILKLKNDTRQSSCNIENDILKTKNEIFCSIFTSRRVKQNVNILSNILKRVTTAITKKNDHYQKFQNLC